MEMTLVGTVVVWMIARGRTTKAFVPHGRRGFIIAIAANNSNAILRRDGCHGRGDDDMMRLVVVCDSVFGKDHSPRLATVKSR